MAVFEGEATSRRWFMEDSEAPPATPTEESTPAPTARPTANASSEPLPPTPSVPPPSADEQVWLPWLRR